MIKEETKFYAYCDIKSCRKRITDDEHKDIVVSRVESNGHFIKQDSDRVNAEYFIVCKDCVSNIITAHLDAQKNGTHVDNKA